MNRKSYQVIEPPNIICVIEWVDASGQEGPVNRAELSGLKRLSSVGWLIYEDEDQVSIAQDYCSTDDTFREALHIPKVNVVRRTEYKHG